MPLYAGDDSDGNSTGSKKKSKKGSPEGIMVTPTRKRRPGNVMGVGRKVTSREIADQSDTRRPKQLITATKEPVSSPARVYCVPLLVVPVASSPSLSV